jgi:hypothetical protein
MRVEVDPGTGVSAKTVGELRKMTAWPENLAITTRRNAIPKRSKGEQGYRSGSHLAETIGRFKECAAFVSKRREFVTLLNGGRQRGHLSSSSYRVQSSSRILSAFGWYLLTVARGPMTITRHPYTGSGITFIAAALMPIFVATISASSDAVFFSTASVSRFFTLSQSSGRLDEVGPREGRLR